jgi:ParB family chromosome partitioning protein
MTTIQTIDIVTIPLNKLVLGKDNVRKTGVKDGIGELKASIAAQGVLQSLVVRKTTKGKFSVIAGQRRLKALSELADEGAIAEDYPVPCGMRNGESDPTEIGLAENTVRAPMHPADQYEAFRDLIDSGKSPADIAARFGISEVAVKQRLKLARVSPKVFKAYREGKLTLEQVQAFTVSDDHAAQNAVLKHGNLHPRDIRSALTQDKIRGTDKRARFVTIAAYEAADGALERDLFAEGDEGVFLLDGELLDRLAREKLEAEAEKLRTEGWKWVESYIEIDRSEMDFRRRHPEPLPLSDELQAELKQLSGEYEALYEGDEELTEAQSDRLDEIDERRNEIESSAEEAYTPETLAIAGAIVTIGRNGEPEVMRGLVKPEDEPEAEETDEPTEKKERPEYSAKLMESLTAARSAAIGASLCDNSHIALAAVVHGLAMSVFGSYSLLGRLRLNADVTRYKEESRGADELKATYERWTERLPGDDIALLVWCLEQSQETLLDLLAFCAGCTVDAVITKQNSSSDCVLHANKLAEALSLDMKEWFTPTAENFFLRVGRQTIVNALTEAKGIPAKRSWQKAKKSELAALAEREIAGTNWLPKPLKA